MITWYKLSQENKEKKIIIMRGIAGSGKSTLARQLGGQGIILSTDEYFMIDGKYQYDIELSGKAHLWNQDRASQAMQNGLSPIVIDNTNVEAWQMKPYVENAIKYEYLIEFVEPNTLWKFNAKELAKRNSHGVPLDVIEDMLSKWDKNIDVEKVLSSEPPEDKEKTTAFNLKRKLDKISTILNSLQKEAGWKENVTMAILGAIVLVLDGSSIYNAAKKYNLSEQQLENALNDQETVSIAKEKMDQYQSNININKNKKQTMESTKKIEETIVNSTQFTLDSIIPAILKHEGLIKGQTPFRYTNDIMKQWSTIHGFPIDKISPRPNNRRNFIFLQDPNDVQKAVKKQFENYINNPSNYGLPKVPSLRQALSKFDQSGLDGKVKFLTTQLPGLKLDIPLAEYL